MAGEPDLIKVLETILLRLKNITNVNLCAVSFCENPDLLSQWRGYASAGGGVAIGFRSQVLVSVALTERGRLGPCIYDDQTQRSIIAEIIEDILHNARTTHKPKDEVDYLQLAASFDNRLIGCGAFFKDYGFREESEWRLVTGRESYTDDKFCFRAGKSMLVPYYKVQITKEDWKSEITSATIGPCPHPEASEQAVHGLFMKHYISDGWSSANFTLRRSKIPYRNW